ncbi:hypothetical protein D770_03265 [Flammeovirgaceae bacterium 311]|nr:hypothetical protein D770_03265 [Flammeovirgaceae bacterium 311]
MNRLLKFFWIASMLLFFGALLLIYAYLDERVGVLSNEWGMPNEFITRETFFYSSLIAFVITNAILYTLHKLLILSRHSAKTERVLALRLDLAAWLLGFAGTLNLLFVFTMLFFGLFNSSENYSIDRYVIFVYAGPLLLAIMFGLLVYILMKRRA